MIIILPVVFISMWYVLYKKERNLIEGLVQAEILYHVALLGLTNVFSIGNLLNRLTVLSGWLVVLFFVFFPHRAHYAHRSHRSHWSHCAHRAHCPRLPPRKSHAPPRFARRNSVAPLTRRWRGLRPLP